jgi:peptidyl-prolyl cis-trans isomerase D
MPFAVFRRHQRKLLAIFAILAMFGFVLADSLPRLLSPNYGGGRQNPVVVELYNKKIYRSDLDEMAVQRNNANLFIGQPIFGEINNRAIVDALILEHEADALHMPVGSEAGKKWLEQATSGLMNRDMFEARLSRFGNRVSGEQILSDIANQARILKVRQLLGSTVVTPLDVYRAYREQNERVGVKAVAFPVEKFVAKVAEPTAQQVQAYYDKYKDVLPDPTRDTPGFKVPRKIKVEVLSIDGTALARGIRDKLTENELLTYYENRKSEFKKSSELPDDLFAGQPELTPPQVQPFAEVRPYIATSLADEKAQAEIVEKFTKIKDEVMIPYSDAYQTALETEAEAKKEGRKASVTYPQFEDLKAVAAKEGLDYEMSPLLSRDAAEHYGQIAEAEVGLTPLSGGRKFAPELFDPKSMLFEPVELTDILRRRYLVRKVDDAAPRVPPLDEIRAEVVLAWKTEQARPLAEKAAKELADQLRKDGGTIKADSVNGQPVIATRPITKLQSGFPVPGQLIQTGPPTLSEIPQIPEAGEEIRKAYFDLEPGQVAVAANQPKSSYYVLTLDRRIPATFATLYAPNGEYFRYRNEAMSDAFRRQEDQALSRLRAEAGVKPDWVPPDEASRKASSEGSES